MKDVAIAVVGAGVSGLSCARALSALGARPRVLERARGVGGRCATRCDARDAALGSSGQPVDFGVLFFHGQAPEFLAALAEVGATSLPGWPKRVVGTGRPCQASAFSGLDRRVAFAEGVSAFPQHLARDLDVSLETEIVGLACRDAGLSLRTRSGAELQVETVVLALALEQSLVLLDALAAGGQGGVELGWARALLRNEASVPCLTAIARYPTAPALAFDLWLPEGSRCLQTLSNEGGKRGGAGDGMLVLQGLPAWSRAMLAEGTPPEVWARTLVDEAARLLGPWAAAPSALHPHRWRYGRLSGSAELAGPLVLNLPNGARVGMCGDLFAPRGGVEAAYLSGLALARRLMAAPESGKDSP